MTITVETPPWSVEFNIHLDAMQTTLKCCGNHGISDWKTNAHVSILNHLKVKWLNISRRRRKMTNFQINNTVDLTVWNLPSSCCSPDRLAESTCDSNIAKTSLYDVGCKVSKSLSFNLVVEEMFKK